MKIQIVVKKYVLLCIFILSAFVSRCEIYSIDFTSDIYPITIKLYRYENNFTQEFIDKIEIKQEYKYSRDIHEFDSYIVYVENYKGFYFFIWDGDVQINLNTKLVYKSAIKHSPLTDEYDTFRTTVEKVIFKEIRDSDTLLAKMDKEGVKEIDLNYKEIKLKRNELLKQGPKKYENFVRNYLESNPKSYISIYFFSEIGLVPDKAEQLILKGMPNHLQKNHRYIRLMSQ